MVGAQGKKEKIEDARGLGLGWAGLGLGFGVTGYSFFNILPNSVEGPVQYSQYIIASRRA